MSDWIEDVHALADGELKGAAKERAEKLVGSDRQAAAEYEWARYIRGTLMAKCDRTADEEVWKRCVKRLDEIDALGNTGKVESFVGRFGWAMASLLFAIILAAGVFNQVSVGNELSSQHLSALIVGEPDVRGVQDADRLIREGLGTGLPTVESVVTVTGASLREVDGISYAIIHMADGSERLLLYVFRDVSGIEGFDKIPGRGGYSGGMLNGHNCVTWSEDDFTFMVMGDRPLDRLVGFADRMRQ
ncbi:MAG: hypothetical protein IIC73_00985 [Armatimonadetes bacterium]|nr:hypothetical protein [Armatimonadota bacterium]